MDVHRRQKHKKELEKNKKARISARDEKVKETKTVGEISKQIKESERRGNKSHGETMKLQRLQKELKLVKEAGASRPKQAPSDNRPLTELDDPRKSVYYDERMNPFGAPPPGKPRLYHRRGGGITMNKDEAAVPGLEEKARREQMKEQPQYISGYGEDGAAVESTNAPQIYMPPRQPPLTPPPPPYSQQRSVPPLPPPGQRHQQQRSIPPPPPLPKEAPPTALPSLPKPSAAVARNRKRKLAADIWASSEEVEYERHHNDMDLEEGVKNIKKESKKKTQDWFYCDNFNNLQGPYSAQHMQLWQQAGYFPPETLVRCMDGPFAKMGTVNFGRETIQVQEKVDDVQARLESLRQQHQAYDAEDEVQTRIEALRQQKQGNAEPEADDGVDRRIQALRQTQVADKAAEMQQSEDDIQARIEAVCQQQSQTEEDDGVESRVQALRQVSEKPVLHPNDVLKLRQASQGERESVVEDGIQARIEALRYDRSSEKYPIVPPSVYPVGDDEEPPVYPVDDFQEPSAYPVGGDDEPQPYLVSGDEELPRYPVGGDQEPAYPMQDVPYPTGDEYLDDFSYPVTNAYPTDEVGAYPVDDGVPDDIIPGDVIPESEPSPAAVPPKKVVKVDKEIVEFMPSHLHKKRRAAKPTSKPTAPRPPPKLSTTPPTKSKLVGDDYETFMKEISGL